MAEQTLARFRRKLLWGFIFLLCSCSTTQRIENRSGNDVYKALGVDKDRDDNVALYKQAASWLHVRHMDGGTSRNGTDCSFLVFNLYKTVYHKTIERNSAGMLSKSCEIISRNKLREGDLVFFATNAASKLYVTHVGIYLKGTKFLHSSTSKGVMVSDLDEAYYRRTWVCGGRVK